MMKKTKIVALILTLCLVFTVAPTASALTIGNLSDATYLVGEEAEPLSIGVYMIGTTFQWQSIVNHIWTNIAGETGASYTPPTDTVGTTDYRCRKVLNSAISYTPFTTIGVLNAPSVTVTPGMQVVTIGGQATFTATAANTAHWELKKSFWAWGPTPDPNDIAGDYSASGTISVTTFNKSMNTAGDIYWFYTAQYTDTITDTRTLTVVSNGGGVDVNYPNPFTDINLPDWYHDDVLFAVHLGLVQGMTTTTYQPNSFLTIAQAIKLAACMHQYYTDGAVTLGNGTPNWYDTYVDYAIDNDIISASTYAGHYNDNATRAEYVEIFYYALPSSEYATIQNVPYGVIPDVAITDSYGYEVYSFYRAGILQGNDSIGSFAPSSDIRRSEVAAIIARMMDPSVRLSEPYLWLN